MTTSLLDNSFNSTDASATAASTAGFDPAGVQGVYNFTINGAPPFSTLTAFINGIDYTNLVAPSPNYSIGDQLITDKNGSVQGRIIVIRSYGSLSQDGDLSVLFYDKSTNKLVSTYSIAKFVSPVNDTTTRSPITLPSGNSSSAVDDASSTSKLGAFASTISPYTQTFVVPGGPGITISSIDLYFGGKDDTAPVAIHLRNVVNGVPSSNEIIPGTVAVKMPNAVYVDAVNEIVDTPEGKKFTKKPVLPTPTNFRIFAKLAPGEYGISIITDSTKYTLFTTKFGTDAPKQPNIGKLFKSQNVNTWIEEENAGICFRLNKAKFATGKRYFELASQAIPYTIYDSIFLNARTVETINTAKVSYDFKGVEYIACTSPSTNFYSSAQPIEKNTPIKLIGRKEVSIAGGMVLGVTLENHDVDSTPILDKSSISLITLKNEIQPYDQDASDSEFTPSGGFVLSKYLSKVVTLQDGFDSTGLEVKVDVNRKLGTDIEVFCRVMSAKDLSNNKIDDLTWRRMPLYNLRASITNPGSLTGLKSYVGLSDTTFNTETYKILEQDSESTTGVASLSYTTLVGGISTTFNSFNRFQIKIAMYSNEGGIVPKIKNLIATAVV